MASVAIRNLASGATDSFSIHRELELWKKERRATFDELERSMLEKFFHFLAEHKGMTFLHWNMRDHKYGFAALEHRYEVLGGNPYVVPDHHKHDLAISIINIFGSDYLPRPHFESLAKANRLTTAGFIPGSEEPTAFEQGYHFDVLQSTLCKVTLIADIAYMAHDRTLRTNANWWTLNVGRLREAYELFDRNPVQAWTGLVLGVFVATFGLALKLL